MLRITQLLYGVYSENIVFIWTFLPRSTAFFAAFPSLIIIACLMNCPDPLLSQCFSKLFYSPSNISYLQVI